jgi:hypothetical protein
MVTFGEFTDKFNNLSEHDVLNLTKINFNNFQELISFQNHLDSLNFYHKLTIPELESLLNNFVNKILKPEWSRLRYFEDLDYYDFLYNFHKKISQQIRRRQRAVEGDVH